MKVTLLQYTPDPQRTAALAARLCYSPATVDDLQTRISDREVESLLGKIMSLGHLSVLEHSSFTFGIDGISRVTSHQLVRHRIASFSQQSQRYVNLAGRCTAVIPPKIAEREELRKKFEAQLEGVQALYAELVEAGVPAEDARYLLPNATTTNIIVTMNARQLLHFFALRCCERAQWEIREMAVEMLRLARGVAPVIFREAGPGCLTGPCPEGTFCCGMTAAVRERFHRLQPLKPKMKQSGK